MRLAARPSADWIVIPAQVPAAARDEAIDTMRGIAILMVIGIHSLQQPLDTPWAVMIDAALRPCVPVFLFVSGYLTALSVRVPLASRLKATLTPYAIAFAAAYIYMALHNPAMDHRIVATLARFGLAYVFVYYYVFVYIGCTLLMWLIFAVARTAPAPNLNSRLVGLLVLSIGAGLLAGSYLDPALAHLGLADSLIEEVRMRDIPFWFAFMATGALVAMACGPARRDTRMFLAAAALAAYGIYAAVRLVGIGDSAAYDSVAFFLYATLLCFWLLTAHPRSQMLATIGSGSYFIYLWHIFIVMMLRDHAALRKLGPLLNTAMTFGLTLPLSVAALLTLRQIASARALRWLGA